MFLIWNNKSKKKLTNKRFILFVWYTIDSFNFLPLYLLTKALHVHFVILIVRQMLILQVMLRQHTLTSYGEIFY